VSAPSRIGFRLLRAEQWVKNAFVFCGVLFSGRFTDPRSLLAAGLTFVAFCLVASAVYIDNDIADREADRLHPLKARRPVASGQIAVGTARVFSALLLAAGIAIAFAMGQRVGALVVLYAVLSAAYSRWLKHVVVLDVMAIAAGFVLRVVAGCAVIEIVRGYGRAAGW
jgi:4-hydroxybenzoate polyprenyltransferase